MVFAGNRRAEDTQETLLAEAMAKISLGIGSLSRNTFLESGHSYLKCHYNELKNDFDV